LGREGCSFFYKENDMAIQESSQRMELAFPSPSRLFTPGVTLLLALIITGYTLLAYAPVFTLNYLMIHPDTLFGRTFWQLVSYSLIEGCPLNLIFAITVLIFMGSAIEREWRTGSFLLLWVVSAVGCAILWFLMCKIRGGIWVGQGSGPGAYAIVGAFGLIFRRKRFFCVLWTVEAQILSLIVIGLGIVITIPSPLYWIWIAGAGVAYLYIKACWWLAKRRQSLPASAMKRKGPFVEID
jgi:membrane associated rhomboid family serine protease